jgi:hypothetical protein
MKRESGIVVRHKCIDGEDCEAVMFFEAAIDSDERMHTFHSIFDSFFYHTPKGKWFKDNVLDSDVEVYTDILRYEKVYKIYGYLTPKHQTIFRLKFPESARV